MKLRPVDLPKVTEATRHRQQEEASFLPSRSLHSYARILASSLAGRREADPEGTSRAVLWVVFPFPHTTLALFPEHFPHLPVTALTTLESYVRRFSCCSAKFRDSFMFVFPCLNAGGGGTVLFSFFIASAIGVFSLNEVFGVFLSLPFAASAHCIVQADGITSL